MRWKPPSLYLALGLLAVLAAGAILWAGRGTAFLGDEWAWIQAALHPRATTYLNPYNGHLVVSTEAFFTVMPRLAGLGHYLPYRLCVLVLQLLIALEVFVLARRRLTNVQALLPAALIALLGTGADACLTAINFDELAATASGLAALALLDHHSRASDLGVGVLVAIALASWTSAIALAAGVLVELLVQGRPGWRRLWVVVIPLVLYAAWRIHWAGGLFADVGVNGAPTPRPITTIGHALQAVTGAFAGILGVQLASPTLRHHLPWLPTAAEVVVGAGAAAALISAIAAWRRRLLVPTPRLLGLLVNGVVLWLLFGVARGALGDSFASRYVYVGAIVLVLIAIEVAAMVPLDLPLRRVVGGLALICVALNVVWGNHLRDETTRARAQLAALQLAGPSTAAPFAPSNAFALAAVRAGTYLAALRRFGGNPGDSLTQLLSAPESAREAADQVLVRAGGLGVRVGGEPSTRGPAPHADSSANVHTRVSGPCLQARAYAAGAWLILTFSAGQSLAASAAEGGGALVLARRFASRFTALTGVASPGTTVTLTAVPGAAAIP